MADQTPPWERFAKNPVNSEAPSKDPSLPPWERFSHVKVGAPAADDMIHVDDMAKETENHLTRLSYTPPSSETWGGFLNRAARATSFGLSDTITAKIIQRQMREEDPDITYDEVLGAVREGFKGDVSVSGEIVGSLAPGTVVAKGAAKAGRVALDAMDRAGLVKGAMNWLAKDKLTQRVVQSSVGGAAAGAGFEAVRVGVDEVIGSAAGENINPDDIRDAAVNGAVVGALLGPVANEALRGAGGLVNWVKQSFGANDQQTMQASKRLISTLAKEGENPDVTVMRLRQDANQFAQDNGRPPALFEIISPDQAREISDISRYYTGLSPRLRNLTEEQVTKSIGTLEKSVTGPKPLRDKEVIESMVEDQFSDTMRLHGDRMVDLGDEAFEALSSNKGFLAMQAKHNPEARQLLRVVDAKENIAKLRADTAKLTNSKISAENAEEITSIRTRIAEILDDQLNASQLPPSELAQLRNLDRMNSALAAQFDKAVKSGYAEANLVNMTETLKAAETMLSKYAQDGFKVSLRSANAMRHAASRGARNANDLSAQAEAIGVRDAISPVGTAEVPSYGRVVKLWNRQMTRAEAQATGKEAARGTISPENLAVRSDKGRLPGRPRAKVLADVKKGIEEGARIDLRASAKSSPADAVRAAERIATSPGTQDTVRKAVPGAGGEDIVRAAKQTSKTLENARSANAARSPSALQEEVNAVRDQVESLVIGNLGGAGKAGLASRYLMRFKVPRRTAEKVINMLGDPAKMDDALVYLAKRRIDLKEFVAVLGNTVKDAEDKKRQSRKK